MEYSGVLPERFNLLNVPIINNEYQSTTKEMPIIVVIIVEQPAVSWCIT